MRHLLISLIPLIPLIALPLLPLAAAAQGDLAEAQRIAGDMAETAAASQRKVERFDDEAQALYERYQRALSERDQLQPYVRELRSLIDGQEAEKQRLDHELQTLEVTRRHILPLMARMVEVLDQWVRLDTPFLPEERRLRVDSLRGLLGRTDVPLAEKFRRVVEAYRIEAEYGLSIEAYAGSLSAGEGTGEGTQSVNFVRVGRVGLYYLSLDGRRAGVWDSRAGTWRELPEQHRAGIEHAMEIAQKLAPPDLVRLPLPRATGPKDPSS